MLWTDIIDPATLTGYARAAMTDYENSRGTLARYLPNQTIADVVARFVSGRNGLLPAAKFRAYDAEPEMGRRGQGKRVVLELPALGMNIPITEYEQLRSRGGVPSDAEALVAIQNTTVITVQAIADAIERMRGIVLASGVATIDQDNFKTTDDFGRPAENQVTAGTLWSDSTADGLTDLQNWCDAYENTAGEAPGSVVMSRAAFRALSRQDMFKTNLITGGSRPATEAEVRAHLESAGIPPIEVFSRRVMYEDAFGNVETASVLPQERVLLLPAPVDPNDSFGTQLGGTWWGRTLTSTDADWAIESGEQPGVVAGAYKNPKPPMGAEVISDAIALPVLANAELSFAADVL